MATPGHSRMASPALVTALVSELYRSGRCKLCALEVPAAFECKCVEMCVVARKYGKVSRCCTLPKATLTKRKYDLHGRSWSRLKIFCESKKNLSIASIVNSKWRASDYDIDNTRCIQEYVADQVVLSVSISCNSTVAWKQSQKYHKHRRSAGP
eukprot:2698262-Pleurochrysis_carterae.AAC.5